MTSKWKKIKQFFVSMYYFQQYVDQYGVYYNRKQFPQVRQYMSKYCLVQYRQLYSEADEAQDANPPNHPLTVSKRTIHIQFPAYFSLAYLLHSLAILSIKWTTQTRERRIWFGAQMFGNVDSYYEIAIVMWSFIVFSFYQFALSDRLLDYKFLALLRMTNEINSKYYGPKDFGMKTLQYKYVSLLYHFANRATILC